MSIDRLKDGSCMGISRLEDRDITSFNEPKDKGSASFNGLRGKGTASFNGLSNKIGSQKGRFAAVLCALVLVMTCMVVCAGCSSEAEESDSTEEKSLASRIVEVDPSDTSEGVAGTVNGVEIGEKAITDYIANFRVINDLETDDEWGAWLIDYAYTIDSIRGETLDYFENQELIRQAAAENGITVSDREINANIDDERKEYDTDEEWIEALAEAGMTEDGYRNLVEVSLLNQKLYSKFEDEATEDGDITQAEQNFNDYMEKFKDDSDITEEFLPKGEPYDIDLTPYEEAARAAMQGSSSSSGSSSSDAGGDSGSGGDSSSSSSGSSSSSSGN